LEIAAPECSKVWELRGVDLAQGSDELGSLQGAVVIANELLDNLPFRVFERIETGWADVYVGETGEELEPTSGADPVAGLAAQIGIGERIPVHDRASAWVRSVLGGGASRLVAFDYGAESTTSLGKRGGWLRTYRGHERGDDPYFEPGRWDITTGIGFDQLPTPTELSTQASFLRHWGIEGLVAEGRRHWNDHASRPDLAAMRMRSRISESEALLDPNGLGGWFVAIWS